MKARAFTPAPHRKKMILIAAVSWAVVVLFSLAWNWRQVNLSLLVLAESEAQASFQKDITYRKWGALHGGVYVPPTESTPPNPDLAHMPERDVITTSGKKLTLVNPAYMTRQVHELGYADYGS